MQILDIYCTNNLQTLLKYYCKNIVPISANVGQVLFKYLTNITKFCVNVEHIFCKYRAKLYGYIV